MSPLATSRCQTSPSAAPGFMSARCLASAPTTHVSSSSAEARRARGGLGETSGFRRSRTQLSAITATGVRPSRQPAFTITSAARRSDCGNANGDAGHALRCLLDDRDAANWDWCWLPLSVTVARAMKRSLCLSRRIATSGQDAGAWSCLASWQMFGGPTRATLTRAMTVRDNVGL
jgi:hypothetical protein